MRVSIDSEKLDLLANVISDKSGEAVPMTLAEMTDAVDGIQTGGGEPVLQSKTYTVDSAGTATITADAGYDGLSSVSVTVSEATPYIGLNRGFYTDGANRKWRVRPEVLFDHGDDQYEGWMNESVGDYAVYNAVPSNTTITPSTSLQTIGGQNYMMEGPVTVAAMPTGSATAPASISGTAATVSTGTNTLTLTKTVSVTPSVTAGYVSSGTAGNSSVSLTANVTTKAAATIRPSTSQQTIASGTYLTGTQTISAVSQTNLTAENIKNGTTVTISNGQSNIFSVTGTYTGGGGSTKNVQAYLGQAQRTANSYGATTVTLTVAKTGTYNVSWTAWRSSSSGTMGTNLYRNSTAGTNQQTFTGTYGQRIQLNNQSYTQGDVLTLYATSGSTSRSIYVANLIIEEQ